MSGDPAIEAGYRAKSGDKDTPDSQGHAIDGAREALKPIREQMAVAHARYSELQDRMLDGATSAETSRYANEMAGIQYLYRLIAPLVYTAEELAS